MGRPGDVPHRQARAAARVAVELGQDDGVDADGLVEAVGDGDRVLPGHRVDHEQHVVRRDLAPDRLELAQQGLVDVQTPRGVEDERREPARGRLFAGGAADLERRLSELSGYRHAELGAERAELIHRGRPLVSAAASTGAAPAWCKAAPASPRSSSCPSPAGPSA
jgi:hypothetical protein